MRLVAFSAGAAPNVTYWLEPLSSSGLADGGAARLSRGVVDASDSLFAKSSAVTT